MPTIVQARLLLFLAASIAVACSEPAQIASETGGSGPVGVGGTGGAGGAIGGGGTGCVENATDMIVESEDGVATRLYVPVLHDGKPEGLFFDTGSALSFLSLGVDGPRYVPDAGEVTVGCEMVTMAGRNFDNWGVVDGVVMVGILGTDYLLARPSEIDTTNALLTRRAVLPSAQAAWPVQSFDDVEGEIIVPVTIDGRAQRLMFDTGSPHLLWLGEEGQPGDIPVTTSDAEGNMLTFYLGEVELEIAGEAPVVVPVLRAPSFPYFEATVAALGGNIHGLLGLSALRGRTLAVDPPASELHLSPR